MNLDENEGLNEVRLAVYRAALKLRSLQKLCQMHLVSIRDLRPVLDAVRGSGEPTVSLSQQNLMHSLEQLFQDVLQEVPEQAVTEAAEQTTRLLFKLYDREETGSVLLRCLEAALVVLSGDTLSAKHRALFQLAVGCSGQQGGESSSVSRSGLRVLLNNLSQVPAVVQESHVFGHVETAVRSCFSGVICASLQEEHFLNWLQSEPRLLLWLSTLYRLSVSETVLHRVRCHACKAFPITGLRYRCLKCLNVHLCQTCFLTETRTRKHKPSHPVLEYCTQPSWKESMASLASSARHALLPRRYTRREAERRRALRPESSLGPLHSASMPVQQQHQLDEPGGFLPRPDSTSSPPSHHHPPPLQMGVESKALQTDEPDTHLQRKTSLLQKDLSTTQKAMQDLQRDKWLLEREFQVWKVAAQSEHDCLEDRCAELETTMEALNHHNQHLEEELERIRHTLTLNRKEAFCSETQQHFHNPNNKQQNGDDTSKKQRTISESSDSHTDSITEEGEPEQEEEKEREEMMVEEEEEKKRIEDNETLPEDQDKAHIDLGLQKEEEPEGETLQEFKEKVELEEEELTIEDPPSDSSTHEEPEMESSNEEDEGEEEEELCDLVQRLKGALLRATPTGSGAHQREVLLQAAGVVGDSVSHLVNSVRSLT
ncbi:dystrotelin isoform X1 [Astyanax mexicanus]|uniref:dystrotelin isoform X1 n=1 Tax=Astyanax mexicanus TaxID=7994 RepID=UPI0020CB0E14|nr:dystrotelin isoform X1 [Astyanax mexicanus]